MVHSVNRPLPNLVIELLRTNLPTHNQHHIGAPPTLCEPMKVKTLGKQQHLPTMDHDGASPLNRDLEFDTHIVW
jgi:hypothetical protein